LPYDFYDSNEIIKNFKLFLNSFNINKIRKLNVRIHPSRKSSKKHQILRDKLNQVIENYSDRFSKNSKTRLSIHVGNTSTVIEALESNVPVIHIVSDPILDLFSSKFWPTLKVSKISNNVFKYSIKKLGNCLIFKKQSNNFNQIHK